MKQAIAAVAYDCASVRVLPDCRVEGTYGYVGIPKKEQLLRLEGADELAANLPFSGGRVAGDLHRDTSLDVALALVGQRVAGRPALGRAELHGDCASATHFVRSATVRAFVLKTGTGAKLHAAAELFAFSSKGSSSSRESIINRDGDLAACSATHPDDPRAAPPAPRSCASSSKPFSRATSPRPPIHSWSKSPPTPAPPASPKNLAANRACVAAQRPANPTCANTAIPKTAPPNAEPATPPAAPDSA